MRKTVEMNRQTAHEMLKKAFEDAARLNGKLATHSLRKSFAQRVYEQSGDIYLVQELLGHRSVSTTQKYLGVNYATAREFVEAIAIGLRNVTKAGKRRVRQSKMYTSFLNLVRITIPKQNTQKTPTSITPDTFKRKTGRNLKKIRRE